MKKTFFGWWLTMLAWLAYSSCADNASDQLLEDVTHIPMSFSVSQMDNTRALSYINGIEDLNTFYLMAQTEEGVLFNDIFNKGSLRADNTYAFTTKKAAEFYWPMDPKKIVEFYAINQNLLPASGPVSEKSIVLSQSQLLDQDVIVAYNESATTSDGNVNLKFEHIMAEVGIYLKTANENMFAEVIDVTLVGESERIYHFDRKSWTSLTKTDEYSINYFNNERGYYLGSSTGYLPLYVDNDPVDNKLVIPGTYKVIVKYNPSAAAWLPIEKETDGIVLQAGHKNNINITLPDS